MPGYLDIHCHILPALDDGPKDVDEAVELVRQLVDLGFTELYPTPHQKDGAWTPTADERAQARNVLNGRLAQEGIQARIHPAGGENMWDGLFMDRQLGQVEGGFPTYPGGSAFLVEFPPDALPPMLEERLFQLRVSTGQLPVVAHVERYPTIASHDERMESLGRSAALLVNLSTLGGMSGWSARRAARKLVKRGLVHAAATDAHGEEDVRYSKAGIAWLRSALGQEATSTLLLDNPRSILAGNLPD
jgi:protein-tyrosine phosphatase